MKTTEQTAKAKREIQIKRDFGVSIHDGSILIQLKFDYKTRLLHMVQDIDSMVYMTDEDYSRMIDSYVIEDYKAQDTFYSVIALDDHTCNLYETLSIIRDMFPDAETVTVYHPNMESIEENTEGNKIRTQFPAIFFHEEINEYEAFYYVIIKPNDTVRVDTVETTGWNISNEPVYTPMKNYGKEFREYLQEMLGGKYIKFFSFIPSERQAFVSEIWMNEDKQYARLQSETEEMIFLDTEDSPYQTVRAIKSFYPNADKVCAILSLHGPDVPADDDDIEEFDWKVLERKENSIPFRECEAMYAVALKTSEEAHLHAEPGSVEGLPWIVKDTKIDDFWFHNGN